MPDLRSSISFCTARCAFRTASHTLVESSIARRVWYFPQATSVGQKVTRASPHLLFSVTNCAECEATKTPHRPSVPLDEARQLVSGTLSPVLVYPCVFPASIRFRYRSDRREQRPQEEELPARSLTRQEDDPSRHFDSTPHLCARFLPC